MTVCRRGTLSALYRYPVKSLVGETLRSAEVTQRGLAWDRHWAVTDPDGKLGSGKSTRRFRRMPGLMEVASCYDGDTAVLTFPDGGRLSAADPEVDAALSRHVGRPVTLHEEREVSHFDEGPVHLVTTAALRALSAARRGPVPARRLRPNLVLDVAGEGMVELGWVGTNVRVGAAVVLRVREPMPRCVMVDLAQAGLPADGHVLASIARVDPDLAFGVVADVVSPGTVALGDAVTA